MAVKKQFSDSDFISGLKLDDDKVLTALYKKFYPPVLKHILNNNGNEQEAQDIYQETILVLYNNCKKNNFELQCSLQTYVYSISKRLWLKQLNKNKSLFKLNEDDGSYVDVANEVNEHKEKEVQFSKMNSSLLELGEPCKTLIEDFYIRQLSMEEIAEKFGYTNADNAKNQKYKCLQRLKRLYFND